MKLNIAYPAAGTQKLLEINDEKKLNVLYEKKIYDEIEGVYLGEEFSGYLFQLTGGCDKQGFAMKPGVMTRDRVRLLLSKGDVGYRAKEHGVRKRKSVRGCIVSQDISVVSLIVLEKGEKEIEGLTDREVPGQYGPKRACKIRKLFGLSKEDDVRDYVIPKKIEPKEEGKEPKYKYPNVTRLLTEEKKVKIEAEREMKRQKKIKSEKAAKEYENLLKERNLLKQKV